MNEEDKRLLGLRAAKLFTPKPWKHLNLRKPADERGFYNYDCPKCGNDLRGFKNWGKDDPCEFPDPIEINWDNAMRLYRSLKRMNCKEYIAAVGPVYQRAGWTLFGDDIHQVAVLKEWLLEEGKEADYILAACQAKEKETKELD